MSRQKESKVADFVQKLYSILEDHQNQQIITWADTEFIIKNPKELITCILPKYFRHSKLQSFVRQLNLYGFKKLTKPHSKEWMFFKNVHFKKGCPELLPKIQLKNKTKDFQQDNLEELSKQRIEELKEAKSNFRGIIDEIYQNLKGYQSHFPQLQESMAQTIFLLRMCGVKEEFPHHYTPQLSITNFLTKFNLEID